MSQGDSQQEAVASRDESREVLSQTDLCEGNVGGRTRITSTCAVRALEERMLREGVTKSGIV